MERRGGLQESSKETCPSDQQCVRIAKAFDNFISIFSIECALGRLRRSPFSTCFPSLLGSLRARLADSTSGPQAGDVNTRMAALNERRPQSSEGSFYVYLMHVKLLIVRGRES